MKTRFLSLLALGATLSFASCNSNTDGKAVTDIDKSAANGGVEASATVIDNDAGPTVTADADSATAMDSTAGARP